VREPHGVDVGQNLACRYVPGAVVHMPRDFGAQQSPSADLKSLDPRRRDGFGAQEQPRECFGVRERVRAVIEPHEFPLGIRDIRCNVGRKGKSSPDERIGNVGSILASASISTGKAGEILRFPLHNLECGHRIIKVVR